MLGDSVTAFHRSRNLEPQSQAGRLLEPHRENTAKDSDGQALGKLEEQKTFQMSSCTSVASKGEVKPSPDSEAGDPAAVLRMKRNTKKIVRHNCVAVTVHLGSFHLFIKK